MEKKGQILIRFSEKTARQLRACSKELNVPINEIVSSIVEDGLGVWSAKKALELAKNFAVLIARENTDGRNAHDDPSGEKRIAKITRNFEDMMREFIHVPPPSSPPKPGSSARKPSKRVK